MSFKDSGTKVEFMIVDPIFEGGVSRPPNMKMELVGGTHFENDLIKTQAMGFGFGGQFSDCNFIMQKFIQKMGQVGWSGEGIKEYGEVHLDAG
jgi:hypothetical protein